MSTYTFRIATEEWEFEQIHRLNYRAFVEEIPQHEPNSERRRVDPFHDQNTYAIALVDNEIVAMLALRSARPFSLDKKLADLDSYLPAKRSICEIRLLYILPDHRNAKVLKGLIEAVGKYGISHNHDMAIISGTTKQQRLYKHMGFVPFGPVVGSGAAQFQPMFLTLDAAFRNTPWVAALQEHKQNLETKTGGRPIVPPGLLPDPVVPPVNYLPGPVNIPERVRTVFAATPVSHRADRFVQDVQMTKRKLCDMVDARHIEFLFGSGTLANEVVAAQLSQHSASGVVLSNGEFGQRIIDHATRWNLPFTAIESEWGEPIDYERLASYLSDHPDVGWLWCVHSETSTGVLNDLPRLTNIANQFDVELCADCISSIGALPISLKDVYLATGTSGKALASLAGIAMVFYNHDVVPAPTSLPRYLDLGYYAATDGVPFTISSNLLYALAAALDCHDEDRLAEIAAMSQKLRSSLERQGLAVVANPACASPAVTSIALPNTVDSVWLGDMLERQGYLLSYKSSYLVRRNWIQVCLMGECRMDAMNSFLELLPLLLRVYVGAEREPQS